MKMPIRECYENRFSSLGIKKKNKIWKILCEFCFQKFVKKSDTIIDIGAGYCEFINNISCTKKYAVDINPDTKKYANKNVVTLQSDASSLPKRFEGIADAVFISNFLEHLNSKEEVLEILMEAKKILKKNGKILILQPNIDLVKERYWDFIDHKIAINGASLQEALTITGFNTEVFIKHFLPYSMTNNIYPMPAFMIKVYLMIPPILRPLTGQSFVVAKKI